MIDEHQRRILSQVVDQIDGCREGRLSPTQALNNIWGLYTAAEVEFTPEVQEFQELFVLATALNDARQEFMPEGLGTDADFEAALDALRVWAARLREQTPGRVTYPHAD